MLELAIYALVALCVSFMCSLLEASLLSVPPSYVGMLVAKGSAAGRRLEHMKNNLNLPLAAILTLNTVAHTAGAAGVGSASARLFGHWSVGLAGALMTLLILVLSEIIPKTLGGVHARRLAGVTATTVAGMMIVTWPVIVVLERLSRVVGRTSGLQPVERMELEAVMTSGHRSGRLTDEEYRIVRNALALFRVKVSRVLTPRTVVFMLPADMTVGEVRERHGDMPYARIPIHEGDADDVSAYVTRTDILRTAADGKPETTLRQLQRQILVIPSVASVRDAMVQMLDRNEHMQLVVDEYGGFEGVVTLEDAIETLLGVEITDETDVVADLQAYARRRGETGRGV